jgi:ribosomal protein S13
MKDSTIKRKLLQEQVDHLQQQLDKSMQLNKDLEEALDRSINKLDLVLASHKVTTQIFSHN